MQNCIYPIFPTKRRKKIPMGSLGFSLSFNYVCLWTKHVSDIIYLTICLSIILFFQKESFSSAALKSLHNLRATLYYSFLLEQKSSMLKHRRRFWKMSFVMSGWRFYDCEQVLKTSRVSYHHYPSRSADRPQSCSMSPSPWSRMSNVQGPRVWSVSPEEKPW